MQKPNTKKKILLFLTLLTASIQDPFHNAQHRNNIGEVFPHSRFIILPSSEPDFFTRPILIQSCSKRSFPQAYKEKIKYDYSGNENAIAFRELEEQGKLTGEVMEVSFHFDGKVKNWFKKKFLNFSKGLKENEQLELFYGFDDKVEPVVREVVKTRFLENGVQEKFSVVGGKEELINLPKVRKMLVKFC
jgi:hypothetical protein